MNVYCYVALKNGDYVTQIFELPEGSEIETVEFGWDQLEGRKPILNTMIENGKEPVDNGNPATTTSSVAQASSVDERGIR